MLLPRRVEPGIRPRAVSLLRPVPWVRSERHGDGRGHRLGGEGHWVSRDKDLWMASSAAEGDGVRVSGVIRLSLVSSLDKIRMQKAAFLILLGFLNFILNFFLFLGIHSQRPLGTLIKYK